LPLRTAWLTRTDLADGVPDRSHTVQKRAKKGDMCLCCMQLAHTEGIIAVSSSYWGSSVLVTATWTASTCFLSPS